MSLESATSAKRFETDFLIRESLIDTFGHMNNSKYLELFEEARWDIINGRGFSIPEIQRNGFGPVVLEVNLRFSKEVKLREKIKIISEVDTSATTGKTMTMIQKMVNEAGAVCCTGRFLFGFFDLKARKLVAPSPEWSRAIGILD